MSQQLNNNATGTQAPAQIKSDPGFTFSENNMKKARAEGKFIRVGGKDVTKRAITGAKRSWADAKPEENQTIFIANVVFGGGEVYPAYLTGTPASIDRSLRAAGWRPDQIQTAFNNAITKDNYQTTMKDVYDAEVNEYERIRKQEGTGYSLGAIQWFAKNIKSAEIVAIKGGERKPVSAGGKGSTKESLLNKFERMMREKSPHFIDVSNFNPDKGTGYNTLKTKPKGKVGSGRIPLITNNLQNYKAALVYMYGIDALKKYAADINVIQTELANPAADEYLSRLGAGSPGQQQERQFIAPQGPVQGQGFGQSFGQGLGQTSQNIPGANLAAEPNFQRVNSPGINQFGQNTQRPLGTINGGNATLPSSGGLGF